MKPDLIPRLFIPTPSPLPTLLQEMLRAVLEEPEEDVHRLAVADWYDENGQTDRAELIRDQIEMARIMDKDASSAEMMAVGSYDRMRDLQNRTVLDLTAEPFGDLGPLDLVSCDCPVTFALAGASLCLTRPPARMTFHRGFLSEVESPCRWWYDHGPALCAVQPVTVVSLPDREPDKDRGLYRWYRMAARPMDEDRLRLLSQSGHWVPGEIARELYGEDRGKRPLSYVYGSRKEAVKSLNAAALRWAIKEGRHRDG